VGRGNSGVADPGSVEFQSMIFVCAAISRFLKAMLLDHALYSIQAHLQRLLSRSITEAHERVALQKH